MLVSWYLPIPMFSLWPCAILLLVFIPITLWHERNWHRTLSEYAELRRTAGAPAGEWPSSGLAHLMGVQPGLVLTVSGMLAAITAFGAWAGAIWPRKPFGFGLPVNPYDLPYLWCMVVAGTAAVVAGVAIALDIRSSPWAGVASNVRRAMYAPPAEKERRFALALATDPEVPHGAEVAAPLTADAAPQPPDRAMPPADPPSAPSPDR